MLKILQKKNLSNFLDSANEEKEMEGNRSKYERISSPLLTNIKNKSFLCVKIFDFYLTSTHLHIYQVLDDTNN